MSSIIRELYSGNLSGHEDSYDRNSEYGKVMQTVSENEEIILKFLTDEEKELFFAFVKANGDLNSVTASDKFRHGFIIGSKLMLEILESKVY